jgi:hypothetical protein
MSNLGHVLDVGMGRCTRDGVKVLNTPKPLALLRIMKWLFGNDYKPTQLLSLANEVLGFELK